MRRAEAGIQVDKFYPPTDWLDNNNKQIDIRKGAENNSIVLLVGHSADFSKYSLLGLLVDTSSGTYDVYIDDVLVGSGITKNTQYDIDFSTINTTYGSATTPESLVLHKVVIKPTTNGATLTKFRTTTTTGGANYQQQGTIWCHLELTNQINLQQCFAQYTKNYNIDLVAITAKGNIIHCASRGVESLVNQGADLSNRTSQHLEYIADVFFKSSGVNTLYGGFCGSVGKIKRIKFICDEALDLGSSIFTYNQNLEQVNVKVKKITLQAFNYIQNMYVQNYKNKTILSNKINNVTAATDFITFANKLFPTKIDMTGSKGLTVFKTYGSASYPMRGLRGLKVSNEAPFSGGSSQINVAYTGLDRDALVELFQSLPTVTGGQTLNCVACSGNNLTIIGSPTINENGVASGFSAYPNPNSYIRIRTSIVSSFSSLKIKIKFERTLEKGAALISNGGNGYSFVGMHLNIDNTSCKVFIKNSTNTYVLNSTVPLGFTMQNNTIYYAYILYKDNKYTWKITDELNNELFSYDYETEEKLTNLRWTLGGSVSDVSYDTWGGNIYLEETSFEIDRNYLVKGYLLDTDKAIATDKGWGLVLS